MQLHVWHSSAAPLILNHTLSRLQDLGLEVWIGYSTALCAVHSYQEASRTANVLCIDHSLTKVILSSNSIHRSWSDTQWFYVPESLQASIKALICDVQRFCSCLKDMHCHKVVLLVAILHCAINFVGPEGTYPSLVWTAVGSSSPCSTFPETNCQYWSDLAN